MSFATVNNTKIHYEYLQNGKDKTLVFSNSLGTNFSMWNPQIEALSQEYNLLFQDTRGHGQSNVTSGEYSAELLGKDVLALLDFLNIEKFAFCGLSMGGLIGQWLGIHAKGRIEKLIICNTAAKIGTQKGWNQRIATVSENGLVNIVPATAERWFTEKFRASSYDQIQPILDVFAKTDVAGYCSNCAMVRDADFRTQLHEIEAPTLVICGTEDTVTTVEDGKFMQEQIPNAQLKAFYAAHLSNVEAATEFNQALLDFLK